MFANWFTFGPDAAPTWMVCADVDGLLGHRHSGNAERVQRRLVRAGLFSYTVDNVSQGKLITRQAFAAGSTLCQ